MNTTIHSLTQHLLQSAISADDLVAYLEGVLVLRKKYGRKIYTKDIINLITSIDPWFASLLRLLLIHNAHHNKDIKQICRQIKQHSKKYTPRFTVSAPKEEYTHPVKEKIQTAFPDSHVSITSHIDVGIEISGEWRHYKRNLDQDIEKLLG